MLHRVLDKSSVGLPLFDNKYNYVGYETVYKIFGHMFCDGRMPKNAHMKFCIFHDFVVNSGYDWKDKKPTLCVQSTPSWGGGSYYAMNQLRKLQLNQTCKELQSSPLVKLINERYFLKTGKHVNVPKKSNGSNLCIGSCIIKTIGLNTMTIENTNAGIYQNVRHWNINDIHIDDTLNQLIFNGSLRFDLL